jgi:hypothetical protein
MSSRANLTPGKDALKLAEIIGREQGIRVLHGRTNGRDCLHLYKTERMDKPVRLSYTIYEQAEWDHHPWNYTVRKKDKRENADIIAAVKNREAV